MAVPTELYNFVKPRKLYNLAKSSLICAFYTTYWGYPRRGKFEQLIAVCPETRVLNSWSIIYKPHLTRLTRAQFSKKPRERANGNVLKSQLKIVFYSWLID